MGLAAVALAAMAGVPGGQEQFRQAANLVSLYVTATDRDGRLVPDLTEADFSVYDNGRLQKLALFSSTLEPFSVVVMLDRSTSMTPHYDRIRDAAAAFVRAMRPDDRARVGSFSETIRISPGNFTSDQRQLVNLLHSDLLGAGGSPVWTALSRSLAVLQPEKGRRVVLVLSDGHDQPPPGIQHTRLGTLMSEARAADVIVYSIGFAAALQSGRDPRSGTVVTAPGRVPQPSRELLNPRRYEPPDPALKDLAVLTGGGYFELDDEADLERTFRRVADELHRQYWLGFVPEKLDGKRHEVEVKTRRRDVNVRTRKEYIAR
jgi:Ca-activated chloride channel family protein